MKLKRLKDSSHSLWPTVSESFKKLFESFFFRIQKLLLNKFLKLLFLVVADVGGYLGLFLGCSLISIVEILFYLATKVLNFVQRNDINQQDEDGDVRSSLEIVVKSLVEEMKEVRNDLAILQGEVRGLREGSSTLEVQESSAVIPNFAQVQNTLNDMTVEDIE